MGNELSTSILNQFLAAMCTLKQAMTDCPDEQWSEGHFDGPFSQVVFHVLIFADIYLGRSEEGIKEQPFHQANKAFFGDYEELEDRLPQNTYDRADIEKYFHFCLEKGRTEIAKETTPSMFGESGFSYRKFNRLEMYIYLIRHIQHHAAQLGLRNQQVVSKGLRWIGSGWRDQ